MKFCIGVVLVVAVVLGIACGGDDDDGGDATAGPTIGRTRAPGEELAAEDVITRMRQLLSAPVVQDKYQNAQLDSITAERVTTGEGWAVIEEYADGEAPEDADAEAWLASLKAESAVESGEAVPGTWYVLLSLEGLSLGDAFVPD